MLVHYKEPKGILYLPNGKRVYGRAHGRPPSNISYEEYRAYRGVFLDATYRTADLNRLLGLSITEDLAFNLTTLPHLPYNYIMHIAALIGARKFQSDVSPKNLCKQIKRVLSQC
jgi:hypothetical protein